MSLFYRVLPASKSCPVRSVAYYPPTAGVPCPVDGILEIKRHGREPSVYAVSEGFVAPTYGRGRAFNLIGQGDDVVWVYIDPDRCLSTCTCEDFYLDYDKPNDCPCWDCDHLTALAAVLAAGRLPDPRDRAANTGEDVGPTETDDQPERE